MRQTTDAELRQVLREHKKRYPKMELTDIVKLIYQSEFGGGHLITDETASLQRIRQEWENCRTVRRESRTPTWEAIGNGIYRLSLNCLEEGLADTTLNRMFTESAKHIQGSVEAFEEKLATLREKEFDVSWEEAEAYLAAYKEKGYPPVSHSETYRQEYAPVYRVVTERFRQAYPVCLAIDKALAKKKEDQDLTVAVDGCCGSGKSTLAELLSEIYDCNVFHMDDYFLRPEQRTEKRYEEAGGNVDYERFREEILERLHEKQGLCYRAFDCRSLTLGEKIRVPHKRINMIEGAYCNHPYFGEEAYDLRFFVDVPKEEQRERILARNGEEMLQRFLNVWIPYENKYFEAYEIRQKCIKVEMRL